MCYYFCLYLQLHLYITQNNESLLSTVPISLVCHKVVTRLSEVVATLSYGGGYKLTRVLILYDHVILSVDE